MTANIAQGFEFLMSWQNMMLIFLGTFAGTIIGALPGLSTTMGIALFVPLTFSLDPLSGLAMLGGIYCGSVYGGSVSATLLRTPGTAASCATVLDSYPMTLKGESVKALSIGLFSSFIGGEFSALILLLIAPPLAMLALAFGSPEYFLVAVFGLTIIISLSQKGYIIKGLISGLVGIGISVVGFDGIEAVPRFTLNNPGLYDGIALIPALIGLFSFAQAIRLFLKKSILDNDQKSQIEAKGKIVKLIEMWKRKIYLLRATVIGTIIGIIPGAGADIASFISYSDAKFFSKNSDDFGTGIPEGIIASEAANNAVVGGSLVPLLTLGVPGNSATAVLLGGLLIHGLAPGPLLFKESPEIVYGFLISLFFANFALLIIGLLGLKVFPKVIQVPNKFLAPIIVVLSVVGSYAISNSIIDVYVMIAFGLLGLIFERYNYPLAPIVIGIILGPMAENALWQSLLISKGSYMIFLSSPICIILILLSIISFGYALYTKK